MARPDASPGTVDGSLASSDRDSDGTDEDDDGLQEELVEAITDTKPMLVLQLLAMRADPDLPTTGGPQQVRLDQTPLWIAMRDQESVACIAWLLIAGADVRPIDLYLRQPTAPHKESIKALLDHYANENELEAFWKEVRRVHGDVPRNQLLHYAAACGSVVSVVRLLLVEQSDPGVEVEMAAYEGERYTPLSAAYCATHGERESDFANIVLMLIAAKADPFARDSEGWCLLDAAESKQDKGLLSVLCHMDGAPEGVMFSPAGSDDECDADMRRAAAEAEELTAAAGAAAELAGFAMRGQIDAVLDRLASGVDPNMPFYDDAENTCTVLRVAAESEAGWETIQYLLAARADPCTVSDDGWSLTAQQDMRLSQLMDSLLYPVDQVQAYQEEIFAAYQQDPANAFRHSNELGLAIPLAHAACDDKPELVCLLLFAKANPDRHARQCASPRAPGALTVGGAALLLPRTVSAAVTDEREVSPSIDVVIKKGHGCGRPGLELRRLHHPTRQASSPLSRACNSRMQPRAPRPLRCTQPHAPNRMQPRAPRPLRCTQPHAPNRMQPDHSLNPPQPNPINNQCLRCRAA